MTSSSVRHVLVLASHAPSLVNFRGALLSAMASAGLRVTAVAPDMDDTVRQALGALGVETHEVATARTGMNPLADLAYHRALTELFRQLKPDVLLAYTAKPVIWGILAARAAGVPRVVAMITGLGYAFTSPSRPNLKQFLASRAARFLYKRALPRADHVLFQNTDDRDLFQALGFTPSSGKISVTAGSGVDLTYFSPAPPPIRPSFLMLARLLNAKGVKEYAQAATNLKARYPEIDFRLAGPYDPGPDTVPRRDVDGWIAAGLNYLGEITDVRPAIAAAAVFVLPSYREGTPRSVLEALATGRAVITTDAPGCRATVVDGENGVLVPPRDADALEAAMERFILQPELVQIMGRASLQRARSHYDVHQVNAHILTVIQNG